MVRNFFEYLSYRMSNENDLSDVTYAMCNSSPLFRDTFLRFFFPQIQISKDINIHREVSKDDSRPDLIIYNEDETYIIENKINDRNQHFGQYENTFNVTPERFGYIANYVIAQPDSEKNYPIKTWEQFYYYLKSNVPEVQEEKSQIEGYLAYLKNVCGIIEFTKPMNIEGIYILYQLMEILNKLCVREEENFSIDIYSKGRTCENGYCDHRVAGTNFELTLKASQKTVWGWIGIFFSEEIPTICIGFTDKENWGKYVCELIKKSTELKEGTYTSAPYEEDGVYWFDYVDGKDTYQEWFNKLSLDEQTLQLKLFMDEVFNFICSLE